MQGFQPFYRYFDFSGRSGRAEYWQYIAITTVFGWVTGILDSLQSMPYEPSHKFTAILALSTIIPTVAVGIRRFHDRGKSGWYYGTILLLIAIAFSVLYVGDQIHKRTGNGVFLGLGFILTVIWFLYTIYGVIQLAKPGDQFANAYGPPPVVGDLPNPFIAAKQSLESFASQQPPRTGPQPHIDPLDQIERLAKLRDAGMLTEEEFTAQKASYLSRLN